jgi:hypothetical protein
MTKQQETSKTTRKCPGLLYTFPVGGEEFRGPHRDTAGQEYRRGVDDDNLLCFISAKKMFLSEKRSVRASRVSRPPTISKGS